MTTQKPGSRAPRARRRSRGRRTRSTCQADLKNSRMSVTSSVGACSGAKWPPTGYSFHLDDGVAPARRGRGRRGRPGSSRRRSAHRTARACCPRRPGLPVDPGGRTGGAGQPIGRDVGQNDVAVDGRLAGGRRVPVDEPLQVPCQLAGRGVVEGVGDGLRSQGHLGRVAVVPVPPHLVRDRLGSVRLRQLGEVCPEPLVVAASASAFTCTPMTFSGATRASAGEMRLP